MKATNIFILCLSACMLSCQKDNGLEPSGKDNVFVEKKVILDASQSYQTMEGFGASDCWMTSVVGKSWINSRDKIAELLFSHDNGIALSMWRSNLGGGSAQQGDASGITEVSRRMESYISEDGSLDWNMCEGQRFFLEKTKEYGCDNVVLFANTPPVNYTYNGKGFSEKGGSANLKEEHYSSFADYMSAVAKHYIADGVKVSMISPVNEPQYNWNNNTQEGSGYQNSEVARLVRELDRSLEKDGLDIGILVPEAGDWSYLYTVKGDAGRSDQMKAFFSPSSECYIGDLKHVRPIMCAHSYWTDNSWENLAYAREKVLSAAQEYKLSLWQTEWSMLSDNFPATEFPGYGLASELDIAMYMSKVIHHDLVTANCASWSFWTASDIERWGHMNRFLLVKLQVASDKQPELEGSFRATKSLWTLGNYSRFIRPGYKRIELSIPYDSMNFFGSAWRSPDGKTIVEIYTNYSKKGARLNHETLNLSDEVSSIVSYTTDSRSDLESKVLSVDQPIDLAPKSVTTVVYTLK